MMKIDEDEFTKVFINLFFSDLEKQLRLVALQNTYASCVILCNGGCHRQHFDGVPPVAACHGFSLAGKLKQNLSIFSCSCSANSKVCAHTACA
jgi:hypothetical protein